MLGWRARLGLILTHPVVGMVPYEFYRIAPPGTLLLAVGLGLPAMEVFWGRSYDEVRDSYLGAVDALVEEGGGVIHLGGGDALLTFGLDGLRHLLADLAAASPVRVKSTPTVLGPALRAVGATKVVLAGNYSKPAFDITVSVLEENGLEVLGIGAGPTSPGAGISPYPAYRAAKAAFQAHPGADGILIVGGNWTPLQIVEEMEGDFGVPVVTSVQAMVWSSFRWIGLNQPLQGAGSLLRAPGPETIP